VIFRAVQSLTSELTLLVLDKLKFCANLGCKNKTGKGFSSFCIPKDTESEQQLEKKRRLLWIKKLKNRIDITDHINFRVCMIIRYYCLVNNSYARIS
jgi:hypothetical protein